jgi:type II secretory pathway pseudopilin PulG
LFRDKLGARNPDRGVTILEILSAAVIIAILAVLLLPAISATRARAQRAQCSANLHSLYVAANLYVTQNGSWPQIGMTANSDTAEEDFAQAWIAVLTPFGPTRKTWICPTIQDLLRNPDYNRAENARIDYTPMPFDEKPTTSHQWQRQPWFVENGDMHGNGNLIIFTDGSISDLKTIAKTASPKP